MWLDETTTGWIASNFPLDSMYHNHKMLSKEEQFVSNKNLCHIPEDLKLTGDMMFNSGLKPDQIFKALQKEWLRILPQNPCPFLKSDISGAYHGKGSCAEFLLAP